MAAQLSFFGSQPLVLEDAPSGGIRYYPGLLNRDESRRLLEMLIAEAPWSTERMWMYDKEVDVPRLVARYAEAEMPALLAAAKETVERFLNESFTSTSLNYYRNERDSVAWHSDHVAELVPQPTIALLSLGATRLMQLRTKAQPRRTHGIDLEAGSLFVMSGRAQEFWEHCIPKSRRASDARISVAFRPRRLSV